MKYELSITMYTDDLENLGLMWRDVMAIIRDEYDLNSDITFGRVQEVSEGRFSVLLKQNEEEAKVPSFVTDGTNERMLNIILGGGQSNMKNEEWNVEKALEEMRNGKSVIVPTESGQFYRHDMVTKTDVNVPFEVIMTLDAFTDELIDITLPENFKLRMKEKKFCERQEHAFDIDEADALMTNYGKIVQDVSDNEIYFMQKVHNPFNGDTTCVTFRVNAVGDVEQVCLQEDFVAKFEGHMFILRETEEL